MRESLRLLILVLQTSSKVRWQGYNHVNKLQAEVHLEFFSITVWKWYAVSLHVRNCDLIFAYKKL